MSILDMGGPTGSATTREVARGEVSSSFGTTPDLTGTACPLFSAVALPTSLVGVTERIVAPGIVSSQVGALPVRALRTVTVPLRLEWFDGLIRTIQVVVIDLDDVTEEIRLDGHTIGFIGRAGRIFVAQTGTRLDQAEECGQCLLWDKAATILVNLLGDRVELEKPDPPVKAREYVSGYHNGDTPQAPTAQGTRMNQMSVLGDP